MSAADGQLAERWRRGDRRAGEVLAERYTPAMGAAAYAVLRDYGQAEEAVQEAFYRAVKGLESLQANGRVGPWLVGITRHVAQDMLRRRRPSAPVQADAAEYPAPSPGEAAIHEEMRRRIGEALDELPADQREIFAMKYIAGLPYVEIARALDTTPEAVGQKLWRIRKKLQTELEAFRP